jgi:16S rRNA (cytidine1402-2'-O)-methyltransferase
MSGRLLVCATPIGNLGDVTFRVLDALREADAILAEDTRVTRKLLGRYDIQTRLERYDEATAERKTPGMIERLLAGETLALVSDAGTPGVSDPGHRMLAAAVDAGVPVEALPGASALLAALVASGLPMRRFYFGGFLPRKVGERKRELEALASLDATLAFFESPHRAAASALALAEVFPGRTAVMGRELTKLHEEVVRGTTESLAENLAERSEIKGEVVLLVGPPVPETQPAPIDADEVRAQVERHVAEGLSRSQAVKRVADDTGLPRKRVYALAHGTDRQGTTRD